MNKQIKIGVVELKKILKWVIVAVVIAAAAIAVYNVKNKGTAAEVFAVSKGEIRQYLEETAQVLSREKQTVYIEGTGKVVGIYGNVGDAVKQGDLLLNLEKSDLELQRKDAEAKIQASKAQLQGTELINYANKIELAKAAVDQSAIAYDSAQRNFEKVKKLYESGAISKDEFEKAQDALKAAAAALNTAELQLADVRQGAPGYLKDSYKSQLEQAVIYRDTILKNLQKQEVKAPMDGVILEKLVDKNAMAAPSAAAFVIGDIRNLELEAEILADDIGKVAIGNEVEIGGKPLGDVIIKGKVIKIAPAAKTVTSSLGVNQKRVPVTIEIAEGMDLLKPGFSVNAKIISAVKKDAVTVPESSVFDYKGKSHVFVIENGKAGLKEVKKGIESDHYVEVLEGLKEGEQILEKPGNTVKEGMIIQPLEKKQ